MATLVKRESKVLVPWTDVDSLPWCLRGIRRVFDVPEGVEKVRFLATPKATRHSLKMEIKPCDCGCKNVGVGPVGSSLIDNFGLLKGKYLDRIRRLVGEIPCKLNVECEWK